MKKIILIFIGIVIVISLTACGYGKLEGKIVDKKYTPSSVAMQMVYTRKTWVYIPRKVKEKWSIKLEKTEDYKIKSTWISVSEEYYNDSKIGEYYLGG